MMFDQLGLSDKALDAVKAAGFTTPTPIQIGAIPPALERRDVLGLAQTGSGKTAAFVLPMLTMLEQGRARARMPRTLILEPTRELAAQVHEAFETLGKNHKLTISLLIGGVSFDEQSAKIDRGADVVIATPGRLLDHLGRGKLMLHGIEILVIDEADRMLDMGFIPDIERICKMLPVTRQTMFFSATMPPEIQRITSQFLHAPVRIEASPPASTAESIVQRFVRTPDEPKTKRELLRRLLREQGEIRNAIVFANRKTTVDMLDKSLKRHGFNAAALHGDMDQRSRLKTLEAFRAGEVTYLIASDVARRACGSTPAPMWPTGASTAGRAAVITGAANEETHSGRGHADVAVGGRRRDRDRSTGWQRRAASGGTDDDGRRFIRDRAGLGHRKAVHYRRRVSGRVDAADGQPHEHCFIHGDGDCAHADPCPAVGRAESLDLASRAHQPQPAGRPAGPASPPSRSGTPTVCAVASRDGSGCGSAGTTCPRSVP